MSSVLDRSELEQSPLADLHLLANELGVDGFRRLRREELVDAILSRQTGNGAAEPEPEPEPGPEANLRPRIPFGPFLILGILQLLFAGPWIRERLTAYLSPLI